MRSGGMEERLLSKLAMAGVECLHEKTEELDALLTAFSFF